MKVYTLSLIIITIGSLKQPSKTGKFLLQNNKFYSHFWTRVKKQKNEKKFKKKQGKRKKY